MARSLSTPLRSQLGVRVRQRMCVREGHAWDGPDACGAEACRTPLSERAGVETLVPATHGTDARGPSSSQREAEAPLAVGHLTIFTETKQNVKDLYTFGKILGERMGRRRAPRLERRQALSRRLGAS
jgi:hypothetical protein